MQKDVEEKCHKLAQLSQKACAIATKLDEDLTDRLSLMDLNFYSFDGLGRLYNDLGKACDVSKLAKVILLFLFIFLFQFLMLLIEKTCQGIKYSNYYSLLVDSYLASVLIWPKSLLRRCQLIGWAWISVQSMKSQ